MAEVGIGQFLLSEEQTEAEAEPSPIQLVFKVFRISGTGDDPIEFRICNISSFIFYLIQTIYAAGLLYKLCRRTEQKPKRSKTLIAATIMIIYCSLVLSVLFGYPKLAIDADSQTDADGKSGLRIYLILFRDLPFSLVTIAHLLVLNQYFELAFILDVLCELRTGWQEASNKLTSRRQCLNALNIIVIAFIVAHFLDKGFYTLKDVNSRASQTVAVFAIIMRAYVFAICGFCSYRVISLVKKELFLHLERKRLATHMTVLGCMLLFSTLYEISYVIWYSVSGDQGQASDGMLILLAVIELLYNLSNVAAVILLGYMMDKMTNELQEDFLEPILNLEVPFFVRLASVKLMNDYFMKGGHPDANNYNMGGEDGRSLGNHSLKTKSIAHSQSASGVATVRGGLYIERELKRMTEAYAALTQDKRWNPHVISLAIQLIVFEVPEEHPDVEQQLVEQMKTFQELSGKDSGGSRSPQQTNRNRMLQESSEFLTKQTERCKSEKQKREMLIARSAPQSMHRFRTMHIRDDLTTNQSPISDD